MPQESWIEIQCNEFFLRLIQAYGPFSAPSLQQLISVMKEVKAQYNQLMLAGEIPKSFNTEEADKMCRYLGKRLAQLQIAPPTEEEKKKLSQRFLASLDQSRTKGS